MRILFVCLGNICRSPIAEGVLKKIAKQYQLDWEIESAGTESFHIDEPPHRFSQLVCGEHDIDISNQRARKFTTSDLDRYDLIYAMALNVYHEMESICRPALLTGKVNLLLNELYPGSQRSVKDPYYGELDGYQEVFDQIEQACKAIIQKYSTNHS